MSEHYYCHDCTEITDGDEVGFCFKCGSDNTFSYTDEQARKPAAPAKETSDE